MPGAVPVTRRDGTVGGPEKGFGTVIDFLILLFR
jgi:hypothetical protein